MHYPVNRVSAFLRNFQPFSLLLCSKCCIFVPAKIYGSKTLEKPGRMAVKCHYLGILIVVFSIQMLYNTEVNEIVTLRGFLI